MRAYPNGIPLFEPDFCDLQTIDLACFGFGRITFVIASSATPRLALSPDASYLTRMRIAVYKIPVVALDKLPDSERNILLSLMLAHNELGTLNKLLLFSLKEILEDALGQLSHSTQTFLILKLMAGKLHETWNLVQKYYVKKKLDLQYYSSLDDLAKDAYQKLKAYFEPRNK